MEARRQDVTRAGAWQGWGLQARAGTLVAAAMVAASALAAFGVSAWVRHDLEVQLVRRAEGLARAVTLLATRHGSGDGLQGFVAALGEARDVALIVVVSGSPPTVVATTHVPWLGRPLAELPTKDVADDLQRALKKGVPHHDLAQGDGTLVDYTAPWGGAGRAPTGAIMIHMDGAGLREELARVHRLLVAAAVLILGALSFALFMVLRWMVVRPIRHIAETMVRRAQGDRAARVPAGRRNELGVVSRAINEVLDLVDENEVHLRTAREQAEAAVSELADHKYATDQHAIVAVADRAGRITYVNDLFCAISGYGREELIGQNHRILASGVHPREFWVDFWRTIAGGRVWHGEICNRAKDGRLYWVATTVVPIKDRKGRVTQYIALRTDISAQKKIAEERAVALAAAEAGVRAKADFLAMMSHEIRTPLSGVIGMTGMLLEGELTPEQREQAETIRRSGEGLLTILNDILDYSKIEAGKLAIESVAFSVRSAVGDVVELLGERASARGVPLAVTVAADVPAWVRGDPGRVRQVLLNYVGNAIKFTEQGTICIRVTRIKGDGGRAFLHCAVEDSGIGIPPEARARLFKPFEQVEASTSRDFGGTGLGLGICRQLAEVMGGSVGVESTVGQGSTFWFRFPLEEAEAPAERPDQVPFSGELPRGLRVLVAEDNTVNQKIITAMLGKLGCATDVVGDGQEATMMAVRRDYDVILMDCHMPVMDGYAATRALRARVGQGARTPIIALTANALDGDRERCLEAGMNDYLTKPVTAAALGATIARWVVHTPARRAIGASPARRQEASSR